MTDRETRRLSFGSVATDYDRYRPGPPPQALDWLIPPGARAVLDLAAGTGAVTRELAGRAARIVAVEPDERMRAVLAARITTGQPNAGIGYELDAIAAVVIGGTSLFGGRGRILSSVVLGALVFELIRNGLNHLGANPYAHRLVSGAVIFAAMYADALKSRVRRTAVGAPAPSEA